jgi:hypothetical protein
VIGGAGEGIFGFYKKKKKNCGAKGIFVFLGVEGSCNVAHELLFNLI